MELNEIFITHYRRRDFDGYKRLPFTEYHYAEARRRRLPVNDRNGMALTTALLLVNGWNQAAADKAYWIDMEDAHDPETICVCRQCVDQAVMRAAK